MHFPLVNQKETNVVLPLKFLFLDLVFFELFFSLVALNTLAIYTKLEKPI
jgi:hypothetical protein